MSDKQLNSVTKTIRQSAGSEKIGDGKIFTLNLNNAIHIRTGKTDNNVL